MQIRLTSPLPRDDALAFREWTMGDVPAVLRACEDRDIHAWTSMPEPSHGAARQWIARQQGDRDTGSAVHFAVIERSSGQVVGNAGFVDFVWDHLRAEVGYWILPGWRGRGYAVRALRLLTEATFAELPIERIDCFVDPPNAGSGCVAKKAGYVYEGRLRSFRVYRGKRSDLDSYARLRSDV